MDYLLSSFMSNSCSGQLADESLETLGTAGMLALKFQLCKSEVERMPTVHGGSPLSIVSGEAGGRGKGDLREKGTQEAKVGEIP